ncbi:DUF447 domain-containing protein [Azoarcus sp. KH32C]|uniref:DUF447 domain-containing protein n=1 Tax=Azoarcus sp. KH32C TaxID=748247 RepID=UPI0002385DE1|nr:DUF447 domain-containing protein [Azoarcus sp. KH32C]BAL27148.1 hypothetical protein AZKH_p0265 [Azoarcus sp. KH32C]
MIFETLVTTVGADGRVHCAPMGARYAADEVVLMPFRPSATLDNILATGVAVMNLTTDVRVFAGCVTGRRDWPTLPAERITGRRLVGALAHVELQLEACDEDPQRPVLHFSRVCERTHAPFPGFNRAQAAVIEGAVLVSRLRMLPAEKIDSEMAYLQIAIDKTAGPTEREAWQWLTEAVAAHRAASGTAQDTTEAAA